MRRRAFLGGIGAVGGLTLARRVDAAPRARAGVIDRLRAAQIEIGSRVSLLGGAPEETIEVALAGTGAARRSGRHGTLALTPVPAAGQPDALELRSTVRSDVRAPVKGHEVELTFSAWSLDSYVVLPGACYAGNRFQSRGPAAYPPLLTEPADIGPNVPPIVPDIPRLSPGGGPSSLVVDAPELAMPAVAVLAVAARLGIIVLADPAAAARALMFSVRESDDRTRAFVTVGPRARSKAGELAVRVYAFECADVPALFERLFALRRDVTTPLRLAETLPFSAAFAAHEARVNRRWVEKPGYLAVGGQDSAYSSWQTGWCSGLMATLPLLAAGSKQSRDRARATIAFALEGQARSGFFHAVSDGKTWFDDGFSAPLPPAEGARARPAAVYKHARRWHLVRRSADALTFLAKQVMLVERQTGGQAGVPSAWIAAARRAADAFARLWERYHQLGQFVDVESGQIVVGGSTSGALAPAGLALAAACCKEPRYLQVAKAIGEHYYDRFVRVGLTCGGPGDALQAPDSQSAMALVESFVTLADATREPVWIDRARAAAHLAASWVVSYEPRAGRGGCAVPGDIAGSVILDAHSRLRAPGYVLASGEALLRLFRATGDEWLLVLLRDTVQNLARQLPAEAGPRVAADDPDCRQRNPRASIIPMDGLLDGIGLLTYTEIPSIYARPDTGFVFVFDRVTVHFEGPIPGGKTLSVTNPTRSEAVLRVLWETTAEAAVPLRPGAVLAAQTAVVPAGATIQLAIPRPRAPSP
jgi:hypothetical protein